MDAASRAVISGPAGEMPKASDSGITDALPCACTQAIRRGERLYIIMKTSPRVKVRGRRGEGVPRLGARPTKNGRETRQQRGENYADSI